MVFNLVKIQMKIIKNVYITSKRFVSSDTILFHHACYMCISYIYIYIHMNAVFLLACFLIFIRL